MDFEGIVRKTRSYRRFDESDRIGRDKLVKLVDMARLSASATNRQPLKYLVYDSEKECEEIFPATAWAGFLKEWPGPVPGERPTGYIIILSDTEIKDHFGVDHGIAAQTIMLGATTMGYGGCMIGSIRKDILRARLQIPERYEILLVLALGRPVEKVVIDEIQYDDYKYWREADGTHHVPKRTLGEVLLNLYKKSP
ncbi:MAG: nitroreductase family protein [Bacteroidetes bacterium]|nr:nitroreductase family protein [Bacteroidota bacterium]